MNKDIPWKQRFQNFEKVFTELENTAKIKKPSKAERAGLIQFFEVCFELAWKMLKDYLESQGFETKFPRDTLKQAFQSDLIEDGHIWMKALEDRNLTTHTYDEKTSVKIEELIRKKYLPLLKKLHQTFLGKQKE